MLSMHISTVRLRDPTVWHDMENTGKHSMRCIIIDDERLAIDLLCSYVGNNPFLELAGTFSDWTEAISFVMKEKVDLIFTDIELNAGINGIEFIKGLPDPPMVIFVSAYGRYAVDSYSLDAVDYLVKPVSPDRFFKAVNKAYEQFVRHGRAPVVAGQPAPLPSSEPVKNADYIFIKTENRLVKVFCSEILYIRGYGDYIKIFLTEGRMLLSLQSLNRIGALLPDTFVRVHRSFIISLDKISEIERKRIRIGREMIPIGDRYQLDFFNKVQ